MIESQNSPSDLYGAVRDELLATLRSLSRAEDDVTVPSCPAWTVKDAVAHLCGLNAELLADIPGSLGSADATARQVADRSSLNLGQVLDEWSSMSDAIDKRFRMDDDKARALLADLVVHVYDLEEVLRQQTSAAAVATPISAHRYVPLLQHRVADKVRMALTVALNDGTIWPPTTTDGMTEISVSTSPHDFLRAVTGRKLRSEVEAFDWSKDPVAILDHAWNQYGPFRK